MKKDIVIPEVIGLDMAIVLEHNALDNSDNWYAYIINNKAIDLDMMVVVSQGFSETKTTSVFRKRIDLLPANSYSKLELMQPDVFKLSNRFQVSFFEDNQIFEKTFIFKEDTITKSNLQFIAALEKKGVSPS